MTVADAAETTAKLYAPGRVRVSFRDPNGRATVTAVAKILVGFPRGDMQFARPSVARVAQW